MASGSSFSFFSFLLLRFQSSSCSCHWLHWVADGKTQIFVLPALSVTCTSAAHPSSREKGFTFLLTPTVICGSHFLLASFWELWQTELCIRTSQTTPIQFYHTHSHTSTDICVSKHAYSLCKIYAVACVLNSILSLLIVTHLGVMSERASRVNEPTAVKVSFKVKTSKTKLENKNQHRRAGNSSECLSQWWFPWICIGLL